MKRTLLSYLTILLFLINSSLSASQLNGQQIVNWQNWDAEAFSAAKQQQKSILLDLEAVWCHWCHVMDQKTYADKTVANYLSEHFITIKVDQDSRPDLALKYKDYGWPATIFFNSDGTEIVKRAGYISPDRMLALLKAIVKDPSPEILSKAFNNEKITQNTSLPDNIRNELLTNHQQNLDRKSGGLKTFQKFIDADTMEYSLTNILHGNLEDKAWAKTTLDNALKLQDPAWGGFYQYSTYGDWQHPHYEKIIKFQARYIKLYAFAYTIFEDKRYLQAAENTAQYVSRFLTDASGAFYVSQDADHIPGEHSDEYFKLTAVEREKLGVPRVDTHIYTRENGWLIEAFTYLYEVTGNQQYLLQAEKALGVIEKDYQDTSGGFSHQAIRSKQTTRFYQSDNAAMARAYLQLYRVTAKRGYLQQSLQSSEFIHQSFFNPTGSYDLALADGTPLAYEPQIGESIELARLFAAQFHTSGNRALLEHVQHVMKYLSRKKVALKTITESGILLVDDEINNLPLHITIIGSKGSTQAKQLFATGLAIPSSVKRIEWWDRTEGKLMNEDVKYPYLEKPAAFVCTNNMCSLPLTTPEKLLKFSLKQLVKANL